MFWKGLPLLEEVKVASCKKLGDDAFLGGALENDSLPLFLHLTSMYAIFYFPFLKFEYFFSTRVETLFLFYVL